MQWLLVLLSIILQSFENFMYYIEALKKRIVSIDEESANEQWAKNLGQTLLDQTIN